MATIINNPGNTDSQGSFAVTIVGIIALLVAIAAFVFYGLPNLQEDRTPAQASGVDMNVKLLQPSGNDGLKDASTPAE